MTEEWRKAEDGHYMTDDEIDLKFTEAMIRQEARMQRFLRGELCFNFTVGGEKND